MSAPRPPHRMRLSIRKNSQLVVWCECMAQTNDQDRSADAKVDWRFWGFDYIAVIPITQPAGPVFRQHVEEYDARAAADEPVTERFWLTPKGVAAADQAHAAMRDTGVVPHDFSGGRDVTAPGRATSAADETTDREERAS